jgi:hypothetical protein
MGEESFPRGRVGTIDPGITRLFFPHVGDAHNFWCSSPSVAVCGVVKSVRRSEIYPGSPSSVTHRFCLDRATSLPVPTTFSSTPHFAIIIIDISQHTS